MDVKDPHEILQLMHYAGAHPSFDSTEILYDFQMGLTLEEVYASMGLEFPPTIH